MKNSAATPRNAYSVEAKFILILAAALLAAFFWWLLSDREPTRKEMTYAYRKHVIALNRNMNPDELAVLRERLHQIELIKQGCVKVKMDQYRCEALVLDNGRLTKGLHGAEIAIYTRDAKGFKFEAIEDDRN